MWNHTISGEQYIFVINLSPLAIRATTIHVLLTEYLYFRKQSERLAQEYII